MTFKSKLLFALASASAASLLACDHPSPNTPCMNVVCAEGTVCDPADGECKRPVADAGSTCNPACSIATPICELGRCRICTATQGCSGATPVCRTAANGGLGGCVECMSNTDCTEPSLPECNAIDHTCGPALDGGADAGAADAGQDAGSTSDAGPGSVPDTCATAEDLSLSSAVPSSVSFVVDTADAGNDYVGSCVTGPHRDVVYRLTLPASRDVTIAATPAPGMSDGGVDPIIFLTGAPCADAADAGSELACSDNTFAGQTETLRINNLPAGEYYVYLEGFGSSGAGPTAVTVTLDTPTLPPTNDSCSAFLELGFDGGVASASGDTSPATNGNATGDQSPSCSASARNTGRDMVYGYTLTAAQDVRITVTPTGTPPTLNPVLYVRAPLQCASPLFTDELACMGKFDATPHVLNLYNQAAGAYSLWIDSSGGTSGAFNLEVRLAAPSPPPPNETCALAAPLSFDGGNTLEVFLNNGSSLDDYRPSCGGGGTGGRDVVYQLEVSEPSAVLFSSVAEGTTDPVIYVGGSPCEAPDAGIGQELFCRDGTFGGSSETIILPSTDAGTYYLFVDAYSSTTSGPQKLTVGLYPPLSPSINDTCALATPIAFVDGGSSVTFLADSTLANDDYRGACSGSGAGGKDLVYSLSLSNASSLTFSARGGSGVDPVIYLGSSPCQGADGGVGSMIACRDVTSGGGMESMSIGSLDAGTYYLYVDGYSAAASGTQAVSVTVGPPTP